MSHSSPCILLVDDEPDILELLSMTIDRMELASVTAASVKEAIVKLKSSRFDLCLTDLRLPDGSGLEIVNFIQQSLPQLPVAVISAHGNMQTAIDAMKAGAFDFVSKPIDLKQLRSLIESALALEDSLNDKKCDNTGPSLLGQSSTIQSIRRQIKRLARNMAPVHIHGESGTGKELVARLIHSCSPRMEKPFIAVNSSAIPAELMESEFFGHLKGSFTGAVADKPGLFQAADGGTLFLDEIADLPLTMQAKLLRAIQERAVRPVGAHDEVSVNIRILSATHQDLHELVRQGKFREDLYYRINVIDLDVPPLRERKEDIPLLTEMILSRIAERNQTTALTIDQSAIDSLQHYSFPGNIRELENILERAAALCEQNSILASDLSLTENVSRAGNDLTPEIGESLDDFLMRIERKMILDALSENKNNKTRTAENLGISFRSLRYKLKKLGIDNQ
jgi:two-component system response regulator PilR (NtrC family)